MTDEAPTRDPRRAAELAARLAHDVGKYLGRTARNLPPEPGALDGELLGMLLRDLYGAGPGPRPGALFASLRSELEPLLREPGRSPARALLAEAATGLLKLDALEPEVRAGRLPALAEALRCALRVESSLRRLSRELAPGPAGGPP